MWKLSSVYILIFLIKKKEKESLNEGSIGKHIQKYSTFIDLELWSRKDAVCPHLCFFFEDSGMFSGIRWSSLFKLRVSLWSCCTFVLSHRQLWISILYLLFPLLLAVALILCSWASETTTLPKVPPVSAAKRRGFGFSLLNSQASWPRQATPSSSEPCFALFFDVAQLTLFYNLRLLLDSGVLCQFFPAQGNCLSFSLLFVIVYFIS